MLIFQIQMLAVRRRYVFKAPLFVYFSLLLPESGVSSAAGAMVVDWLNGVHI